MTEHENELREHMTMKLFNFRLDDVTKVKVLRKLRFHDCDTKKGTLSSLIRVLLNHFAESTDTTYIEHICDEVQKEYTFTTKKNKRSSL